MNSPPVPTSVASPVVTELVRRIDAAMAPSDDARRCRSVKQVLADVVGRGGAFLPESFLAPTPTAYARRLLHRDPTGRYSVVVMVWDRAQGTPLHDHAGTWCVECVYRGEIRVTSFSIRGGDPEEDVVRFEKESVVVAGRGEAGALIPPFEYHLIENPAPDPAVTIHVYGGEVMHCHVFEPLGGGRFRRAYRELGYTA
jgi:predicted metal-dependent enzyme (double-stranded beta helix superfamily)